jgi:hypothetical protein
MELIVESDKMAFKGYEIIINEDQKYGIIDSTGKQIVDCVFDNIEWLREENLTRFCLHGRYALYYIDDIRSLIA